MNNGSGRTANMRQNRRARGRSGGRKMPNPLTRSYESNGPDVKVRGTASNIAEKYQQLARDALASGDPIAAENYYQHAEHYLRIIATAQAQQNAAQEERAAEATAEDGDGRDGRRQDRQRGRNGGGDANGRGREEESRTTSNGGAQAIQAASDAEAADSGSESAELASMPAFLRNGPSAPIEQDGANGEVTDGDDASKDALADGDAVEDPKPARGRPRRGGARKPAASSDTASDGDEERPADG